MPGSRPTGPTPDAAAGIKAAVPDLARLPIVFNRRAFSLAEGVRAGLSTAVIIAAREWLEFPGLIEAALGALFTCLCDAGGPIRRRVPALLWAWSPLREQRERGRGGDGRRGPSFEAAAVCCRRGRRRRRSTRRGR